MARRLNITLSDRQFTFLDAEADRSSVSMAELIRRALDATYGADGERTVVTIQHVLGRRPGRALS